MGRHRGLTLLELLIVVVLLSTVAALGSFKLGRRNRHTAVQGLAQELFARAAGARLTALRSGCQVRLLLDPEDGDGDGRVALLQVATRPGLAAAPSFAPPADAVTARRDARLVALAPQVDLAGPPPAGPAAGAILFLPDGTVRLASGTGRTGVTLYLADSEGRNPFRVVLYGRTGFAKVLSR
jgi:prepilin-type N-terminal cleavage/methylation domain-containing protein